MPEKLKPCPFCGGNAKIETYVTTTIPHQPIAKIICVKCRASTGRIIDVNNNGRFIDDVRERWNRRTDHE